MISWCSDLGLTDILESLTTLRLVRKELPSQSKPLTNRPSNLQEGKPNPVQAMIDSTLDRAKHANRLALRFARRSLSVAASTV